MLSWLLMLNLAWSLWCGQLLTWGHHILHQSALQPNNLNMVIDSNSPRWLVVSNDPHRIWNRYELYFCRWIIWMASIQWCSKHKYVVYVFLYFLTYPGWWSAALWFDHFAAEFWSFCPFCSHRLMFHLYRLYPLLEFNLVLGLRLAAPVYNKTSENIQSSKNADWIKTHNEPKNKSHVECVLWTWAYFPTFSRG